MSDGHGMSSMFHYISPTDVPPAGQAQVPYDNTPLVFRRQTPTAPMPWQSRDAPAFIDEGMRGQLPPDLVALATTRLRTLTATPLRKATLACLIIGALIVVF